MRFLVNSRTLLTAYSIALLTVVLPGFVSNCPAADDIPAGGYRQSTLKTTDPVLIPEKMFSDENRGKKEKFNIAIGPERMYGHTTYKIGYPATNPNGSKESGYFPFSQLEWPLDIWLVRAEARYNINDSLRINGVIKKSISGSDSHMKDSDWLTDSNPSRLDVYSESTVSELNAWIFDIDAEWLFFQKPSWSLYSGLGYQYQIFDYKSKVIRQYSPSGLPDADYVGDGRVSITYNMTYSMPYLKIGGGYVFRDKLILDGNFAWSPLVNAKDEDNHLLRENGGKICKGDMDGNAYMVNLSARYNITPAWFVKSGFSFTLIDVDGEQRQVYGNGTPIGTVRETSESTQISALLTFGYAF